MRRWIRRRFYRGAHRVAWGELSTAQVAARVQLPPLRSVEEIRTTPLEDLMPTMLVPVVGAEP